MSIRHLALLLALAPLAQAKITFTGLAVAGEDSRFNLQDDDSSASKWVAIGDAFEGYTVKQFDATDDTLVVASGSGTLTLHLEEAPIAAAAPAVIVQPGSRLRLTFPGDPELDRLVLVAPDGSVALPLVGRIHLAGLTPESAAAAISFAYSHAHHGRVLKFGAHLRILPPS